VERGSVLSCGRRRHLVGTRGCGAAGCVSGGLRCQCQLESAARKWQSILEFAAECVVRCRRPAPQSPAVRPSQLAGSRAAAAVARVPNCDVSGLYVESSPVISGSDMFIMCELSDSGSQVVARVNLTTNKLVKTYLAAHPTGELTGLAVDGGAMWVAVGNTCIDPCTGVFHVLRVDLVSGKVTRDLVDRMLVGVASSYVVVSDYPFRHDYKLDPATGNSKGQIPSGIGRSYRRLWLAMEHKHKRHRYRRHHHAAAPRCERKGPGQFHRAGHGGGPSADRQRVLGHSNRPAHSRTLTT